MNKIQVDVEEFVVRDVEAVLDILTSKVCFYVYGHNVVKLNILHEVCLDIFLYDDSSLEIKTMQQGKKGDYKINIKQYNRTNFVYKEGIDSEFASQLVIENVILGNDNKSEIVVRSVQKKAKIGLYIAAHVNKGTKNNEIVEDVKGINHGGKILIEPNMMINSSEVMANHFVTIGTIPSSDLFYLESKGLSQARAEQLILEGFLKEIWK